jgi:hypothetical protein
MLLSCRVYDALLAAPGPCTRAAIEAATGLVSDEVKVGLRGLRRRSLLIIAGNDRGHRALYSLPEGAVRPHDVRGQYPRTPTHRQIKSTLRLANLGRACLIPSYSPARPPSHQAAPARRVAPFGERFLLAEFWRKR